MISLTYLQNLNMKFNEKELSSKIIQQIEYQIIFLSYFGKYLSAQPDCSLQCNRDRIGEWEVFKLIHIGKSRYYIKSHHQKYLSALSNGNIVISQLHPGDCETFEIMRNNNGCSIKSFHGKYFSVQPNGGIKCNKDNANVSEMLIFE
jgi:hypothetical protein